MLEESEVFEPFKGQMSWDAFLRRACVECGAKRQGAGETPEIALAVDYLDSAKNSLITVKCHM